MRPTVLVADDDADVIELVTRTLERDYDVCSAMDGEQAIAKIEELRPACVVLDVMMPVKNGWEVARWVRRHGELSRTAIVMLTGVGETLNELTSPLYGADEYLNKPFRASALREAVARAIERAGRG